MIIITGMDNSGKTTLSEYVSKELGMNLIKSPGKDISPQEQKEWVLEVMVSLLEESGISNLYERFPLLEELIYGKILRGESNFEYDDKYFELLKSVDPLIVYTRPSNAKILDFGDRPQMEGVVERAKELLMAYDELMFKMISSGWRVIPYNFEINEPQEVVVAYQISNMLKGVVMF